MEGGNTKRRKIEIPGVRYLFALNGFLGFTVVYGLRVNLNVAIVAMVNSTAVYDHKNESHGDECPAHTPMLDINSTESQQDGPFLWFPGTQGTILAAFFYGYCASQVLGGRLADMYSGKWVFGAGALVMALLSLLVPVAADHSIAALVAVRVLQGAAQGAATPAMNTLLGRWLPDTEKGFLNSVVHAGVNVGTMVVMPLTSFLCESSFLGGWPAVFYVQGICAIIWFIIWFFLVTDNPKDHPFISKKEINYIEENQRFNTKIEIPPIPWRKIAKSVPFWTYIIVQFCQDWSFYTLTTDLPTYFATILHFPLTENGFFSSLPHFLQSVLGIFVTLVMDWVIRSGRASTERVRKVCNSISGYGTALGLLGVCFAGCDILANKLYFIFTIGIAAFCYSGHVLTVLDMSPEYVGTLQGIANTISNLTGFLAPQIVGILTEKEQTFVQWRIVFGITASLVFFATTLFIFFGTAQKQDWAEAGLYGTFSGVPERPSADKKKYVPLND